MPSLNRREDLRRTSGMELKLLLVKEKTTDIWILMCRQISYKQRNLSFVFHRSEEKRVKKSDCPPTSISY